MRPVISWRFALVLRRVNLGGASGEVTRRILQFEVDRVHASVAAVNALGAQLDGLAIAGDYNVIQRSSRTASVLRLVACYPSDVHVVNGERITVIANARNKVSGGERVITMVGRPHRRRLAIERNCRRLGVIYRDRLATRRLIARTVSRRPSDSRSAA